MPPTTGPVPSLCRTPRLRAGAGGRPGTPAAGGQQTGGNSAGHREGNGEGNGNESRTEIRHGEGARPVTAGRS